MRVTPFLRHRATAIFGCLLWAAFPAHADAVSPSFDCAKADSSAEALICADEGLARLDQRMADRFTAAMTAAAQMIVDSETEVDQLKAVQRGWIKGRDDCWKADDLRTCVMDAYLTREGELVAQWMLQDSLALQSYLCDKNPANEVTVFFFDTELPSIRLEYGDSIRTGSLVRAASGSKYATGFGTYIWIKGDTAQFSPQEGQEISCIATQ